MNGNLMGVGYSPIGCASSQPKQQEGFFDRFIGEFYQKNNEFEKLLDEFGNLFYKLSNQNVRDAEVCGNDPSCIESNDIVSNFTRLGNKYSNNIDYLREILDNFKRYI